MKPFNEMNEIDWVIFSIAVIGLFVVLLVLILPNNSDHCTGSNYDYGVCVMERVDSCMKTERFTRDECVQLAAGNNK